jgi:hypothetical protein
MLLKVVFVNYSPAVGRAFRPWRSASQKRVESNPSFDASKSRSVVLSQSMTSEVKKTLSMDRAGVRARQRDERLSMFAAAGPASLLLTDLFRTARI